jgi:arsenate reductase
MAEAMLRHFGGDRFEAYSAGSHPAGFVHALATEALMRMNVPIDTFISKSWDEYAHKKMDAVITLCDAAADEPCPVWPGDPIRAHWSLPDPVAHPGTDRERLDFAITIAGRLETKILAMIGLDWSLPKERLQEQITRLGEI